MCRIWAGMKGQKRGGEFQAGRRRAEMTRYEKRRLRATLTHNDSKGTCIHLMASERAV